MAEPQGGVGRHTTLSVNDRSNAIHRHVDLSGQFSGRHAKLVQLQGEMFAWVNEGACHGALLMIIDDLKRLGNQYLREHPITVHSCKTTNPMASMNVIAKPIADPGVA